MRRYIALLVTAVALAVGINTALATIPDSGGTIHGCYATSGGNVRVIDSEAGGKCGANYTPINWSKAFVGTKVESIEASVPSSPEENATVDAINCPSGYVALSGNYSAPAVSSKLFIATSRGISSTTGLPAAENNDRWEWVTDNTTGSTQTITFYVTCAKRT